MVPNAAAMPALDAFAREIADLLHHDAFTMFGSVTVKRQDVRTWADAWSLDSPTEAEARVMSELFLGSSAPLGRRLGGKADAVRRDQWVNGGC